MNDPDYKAALFEVLAHLAQTEDHGCDRRTLVHLNVALADAERRGEHAMRLALEEAIKHLVLHQTNRPLDAIARRGRKRASPPPDQPGT